MPETVKETRLELKRRFALAANVLDEQTAQLKQQAAQIQKMSAQLDQTGTPNGPERVIKSSPRGERKRFVAQAQEKLTAFVELKSAIRGISQFHAPMHC